jgi:hypothetical protein
MEKLKDCPECGEEIKEIANKCKHCHANLNNDAGGTFIIGVIIGIVLFYAGGWDILWSESASLGIFTTPKDFIYEFESGFAMLVNGNYYGLVYENRFFDSSGLSWGLLALGVMLILPIKMFFFCGSTGSED